MAAPLFRRVLKVVPGSKPKRWKRAWQRIAFPTGTHYSPNFTRRELECRCGCKTPLVIQRRLRLLALDLERLRAILGPIGIVSGYRCPARNKAVHGASQSQHLTGNAADLNVPAGKQDAYVRAALQVPAFNHGGIGVYPNGGVHVDRRGWVARWNDWVRS